MTLGLARLRLKPDDFWRLTPRELLLMAGYGVQTEAAPDRAALEALMARYGAA
jgi:uncharacterized phage protein (TIGR02216 family)